MSGGKTGFFRRLSFSEPSPTLVTVPTMPATDLIHPTETSTFIKLKNTLESKDFLIIGNLEGK